MAQTAKEYDKHSHGLNALIAYKMSHAELAANIMGLDRSWRTYSYGAALMGLAPNKLIIIEPHYKECSLTELAAMRDWENTSLAHMIQRAKVVMRLQGPITFLRQG